MAETHVSVLLEVADDRARAERLLGTASWDAQVITWRESEVELRGSDRVWSPDPVHGTTTRWRT